LFRRERTPIVVALTQGVTVTAHTSKAKILVIGSLLAAAPAMAPAQSIIRVVDCASGASIQEAVGKGNSGRPLVVVIQGACNQNVEIARDDVELRGEANASLTGSLEIRGARRAVVANLTLTNPAGDGVLVDDGAAVTLENNRINDSAGYGVFVRNASLALVNNNEMFRNGIVNSTTIDASGIGVSMGSTVRARGNRIAENANSGIEIFDSSVYRSQGDSIAMRTSAPGRSAVDTFRGGHTELRDATVSGHVFVNQKSQLQVRNQDATSTLSDGNIQAGTLSFLRLRAGVVRSNSALSCGGGFAVCQCDPAPFCEPFVP
jgi:parallel beta-helix repeat protein